ncbi:uncharacterized protein LOC143564697 [Bidens hawaiensis]|uniref:uncharacterized protein LOC143564697 n=1 Tax=Bidens hawaiensis TaxID=980011 RepID=UPI00404A4437
MDGPDQGIPRRGNPSAAEGGSPKIRHKALQYQLRDEILYRRSFLGPLLLRVDAEDASYLIQEIHEEICGLHAGPRMVVAKITNTGYYWPDIHMRVVKELRKCDSCQWHASNTLRPKNDLIPVSSARPFQKWAINIMDHSPKPQEE